jgi:hypothetical protein
MELEWVLDFASHPMGFDLNEAWGTSELRIPDCTVALSSQSTTEPQARIRRRSIQVTSRRISQMNGSLIRARQPLPFPNPVQYGPWTVVRGCSSFTTLKILICCITPPDETV